MLNPFLFPGVPFHGEFSSANASALTEANSRFTLYGADSGDGSGASALTLGASDIVMVTDITITGATAYTIQLYDGANNVVDAGEQIVKATFLTTLTQFVWAAAFCPHYCQKGTYPKLIASATGQVDSTIRGFIYTHPGT